MAKDYEETSFNVENLEPPKQMAKVDLLARMREATEAAKNPPKAATSAPPASAAGASPTTKKGSPVTPVAAKQRRRLLPLTLAIGLLFLGLTAGGIYVTTKDDAPVAVDEATPTPRPSQRPSARPSARPSPTPQPAPKPPAPAPKPAAPTTYVVQEGDSLITIGEKLKKDWRAIAAANGNIQDPDLIYPGQTLRIP